MAVVVLALVVAGLGGWAAVRYVGGAQGPSGQAGTGPTGPGPTGPGPTSPGPSSTETARRTVTPTYVPFDLPGAVGNAVFILGIWNDVAVFRLAPGDGAEPYDLLRAVSVETGKVLWQLDTLPGGARFSMSGIAVSGDRIALSLDPPIDQGCPGSYVVVLALTTGATLSDGQFDATCDGTGRVAPAVVAYAQGVVVVGDLTRRLYDAKRMAIPAGQVTEAFAETDLATPLWRVDADRGGRSAFDWAWLTQWWSFSDPLLGDTWVRTVAGTYVGVTDGRPTGMRLPEADQGTFGAFPALYRSVPGDALKIAYADGTWSWSGGWSDSGGTSAAWTWTLAPGWSTPYDAVECLPSGGFGVETEYIPGSDIDTTAITVIDVADGSTRWSASYAPPEWVGTCGTVTHGDQELVAYAVNTAIAVADAQTGQVIGRSADVIDPKVLDVDGSPFRNIAGCGDGLVCLVARTDFYSMPAALTVAVVDVTTPDIPIVWTANLTSVSWDWSRLAIPSHAGLVIPVIAGDGTYQFLIL